ncbi:MAG: phage tail tip lysozyme [Streptosporangiaceae bacterium]
MSVSQHSKEWKIRRSGRHATPSGVQKAVRRAGRAAPAFAVIGALAAVPQVRDLVIGGHAPAGHVTGTRVAGSDEIGGAGHAQSRQVQHIKAGRADHLSARTKTGSPVARDTGVPLSPAVSPPPAASPPAAPSPPAASTPPVARSGAVTCSATAGGMLPDNYAAIVTFLTRNGYTGVAAAGIAGNMYQESRGNPESVGDGGGGLIGWTPLPGGLITGNPAADLQAQLKAVLTYNQVWARYIPTLNAATTPAQAAGIYVTDFERAGIPAAGTREAAAEAVATACGI